MFTRVRGVLSICPGFLSKSRTHPVTCGLTQKGVMYLTDRVILTPEQVEKLIEKACARSFQHDEVACISLLDLELILQKGATAFDE